MSQINRGAVLATKVQRSSFAFIGVIRNFQIADPRRPTAGSDFLTVELLSDPFSQPGSGETLVGKLVSVFLEPKGASPSDEAALANSVVGLVQGYEIRPPIEMNHICAFEKGTYEAASRSIRAEYVKVGASPTTRAEGMAISYIDQWAAVLPARVTGTDVRQTVAILNIKDTVRFMDFREIEALIDEVKHINKTPKGGTIGHPAFLVLSRRVPSGPSEENPAFFADDRSRLASMVVMSPRMEKVGGAETFVPMTTQTALASIDLNHKTLVLDRPGWYHEFIPMLALPVGKNIRPKVSSTKPSFDRHVSFQIQDKDAATGEIVPAGFGFARSLIMAQCSSRTGSWIASFVSPVSSFPTLVPPFELITPETHPGHKAACLAEINRLSEVRKERVQQMVEKRRQRPEYGQTQAPRSGQQGTGWGSPQPQPAAQPARRHGGDWGLTV